jgi:hypothetical protein
MKDPDGAAPLFLLDGRGGGVWGGVLVRYPTILSNAAIASAILCQSDHFGYLKERADAPKSLFQNETVLPPDL